MRAVLFAEVVGNVVKNLAMSIPAVARWRLRRPRTGPATVLSRAALDRYVFAGLDAVMTDAGALTDLDVLEIGPGDHLGLGLACLANGARSYTALDRFPGAYGSSLAKGWYRAVQNAWPGPWPAWLDVERFPEGFSERVLVDPVSVETCASRVQVRRYDVLCSVAVGEHVSDITAFARATARLIKDDGVAVHVIDFSQHGWTSHGDPLLFLRFPDWLWRLMGSARGLPNRRRIHEYIEAFTDAGLTVEIHGVDRLKGIDRTALAPRFRSMPMESLEVQGAIMVCRLGRNSIDGLA